MRTKDAIRLIAAAGLTLSLAACGAQDDDNGVATAGGGSSPSASATGSPSQADQYKFSQCMRDNGIADWPDPQPAGNGGNRIEAPSGADPKKVDAAREKCKQYMPNGGERPKVDAGMAEQMRKFAQCMRENGVPKFPDPAADGGMVQLDPNSGIKPDSPEFRAAQEECQQLMPRPSQSAGSVGSNG